MRPEDIAQRVLTVGLAASVLLFALGLGSYLAAGYGDFPAKVLLMATTVLVATPFLTITAVIAAHVARREFYNAAVAIFVFLLMLLSVVLGLKH